MSPAPPRHTTPSRSRINPSYWLRTLGATCRGRLLPAGSASRILRSGALRRLFGPEPRVGSDTCGRRGPGRRRSGRAGRRGRPGDSAHRFPLGPTMDSARRAALLAWAKRQDAVVIEDDYDGEFRYDRRPIGALQGLDPNRVVYAGTAVKTLAPGVRL